MPVEKLTIIIAEDDDGHASLLRRNLERANTGAAFMRVRNGQELIELLSREINGELSGRSAVVLLDIDMPKMGGVEALAAIKLNPALRQIPVYMLTTTDNPAEVSRCFRAGCNAYLMKPVSYQQFIAAIERLSAFLQVAQHPTLTSDHASA